MTVRSIPTDDDDFAIPCSRCGYDVRMQPIDGRCPECEAPVARSRELAMFPTRPTWRASDPRWRRRMVAGAWVLTAVPLLSALRELGWDRYVRVPAFYAVQGSPTLQDSYVGEVYAYLMLVIGTALLFSRERFRRANRFDWTRRWGGVASWGVLVLGIPMVAFIGALVMVGIAAMFISMRPGDQPAVTGPFLAISRAYLRFGPIPSPLLAFALLACSSIVVLLACVPLFDAMRSSGRRGWAIAVLLPLAASAVLQIAYASIHVLDPSRGSANTWPTAYAAEHVAHSLYFEPDALAKGFEANGWRSIHAAFVLEAIKWLACLTIAVWLSVAQLAAIARRSRQRL